jgi:hypothetical protein
MGHRYDTVHTNFGYERFNQMPPDETGGSCNQVFTFFRGGRMHGARMERRDFHPYSGLRPTAVQKCASHDSHGPTAGWMGNASVLFMREALAASAGFTQKVSSTGCG